MKESLKKIRKSNIVSDFRKFINKGNVVDMAVGVIIGSAFSKIVSSLVNDIITPLISLITGNVNFSDVALVLRKEQLNEAGEVVKAGVSLNYGQFIQNILDFLIIALCVFFFVRMFTKVRSLEEKYLKAKEEEKSEVPPPPPPPTKEELILTEIRDLLKEKNRI
jgi:large conductance mechanosensitive channel